MNPVPPVTNTLTFSSPYIADRTLHDTRGISLAALSGWEHAAGHGRNTQGDKRSGSRAFRGVAQWKGPETIRDLGAGVPNESELEPSGGVPHRLGGASEAGGVEVRSSAGAHRPRSGVWRRLRRNQPVALTYGACCSLVSVSQDGLCALLGWPGLMSTPSGGFGGTAGQARRSALVCLTTM